MKIRRKAATLATTMVTFGFAVLGGTVSAAWKEPLNLTAFSKKKACKALLFTSIRIRETTSVTIR
ncbi:hypothetical protein [Luteolibacter sp. AS25]|uniref:hypothetical protein n=1 Tax=Luteolibacter sp. AS25 TaxID=3135776 RepID=UPI00398B3E71